MFKRWTVWDGVANEHLKERFWFRRDAQDMRDAIEFLYVLDDSSDPLFDPLEADYASLIKVVKA